MKYSLWFIYLHSNPSIIFFMEYTYFVDITSWFFILFIVNTLIESVLSSILGWLNSEKRGLRRKMASLHSFGDVAKRLFPFKKVQRALNYKRTLDGFSDVVGSVGSGFTLIVVMFGITPFMISFFSTMFPSLPMVWCWIIVSSIGYLVCSAFKAAIEHYKDFNIEKRYGFNTKTEKIFATDFFKETAIGIIILVVMQLFFNYILSKFGDVNPVSISLFVLSVVCVGKCLQWLFINVIMQMFNKFEPLKDGELKDKITELCKNCGFKISKIEVMDASKRSNHSNAFICGSFGKKKIVLFDTLMKNLTTNEIVSVIAHEIGHAKLHHLFFKNLQAVLTIAIGTTVAFTLMKTVGFYHAFGYSWVCAENIAQNYIIGFNLASMFMGVFGWIFLPLSSYISRKMEYAADEYAVKNTYWSSDMIDALMKLTSDNLSDLFPHPAFEFVNYSHPSILNRVNRIKKLD